MTGEPNGKWYILKKIIEKKIKKWISDNLLFSQHGSTNDFLLLYILLLLIHCLWLLPLFWVVFVLTLFLMYCFMSFLVLKPFSWWRGRACCFTFTVFWYHVTYTSLCLFFTVQRVSLQRLIVPFAGLTHFFTFGAWLLGIICYSCFLFVV